MKLEKRFDKVNTFIFTEKPMLLSTKLVFKYAVDKRFIKYIQLIFCVKYPILMRLFIVNKFVIMTTGVEQYEHFKYFSVCFAIGLARMASHPTSRIATIVYI